MRLIKPGLCLLFTYLLSAVYPAFGQVECSGTGQTPYTAFPVCGTKTFRQGSVPTCGTKPIYVPGCGNYTNKNPYFYKFTCFKRGTLGFTIKPFGTNEDYDWQIWDITSRNLDSFYTDQAREWVLTGNWAGTYGTTGTSTKGSDYIECFSDPAAKVSPFSKLPNIHEGHTYLLMISHWTDSQSGYELYFNSGTAVITDSTEPHLKSVTPDCEGNVLTLKLNKKLRCNTLVASGSEFSIVPAVTTVVSATSSTCASGLDLSEISLTLAAPLPPGDYKLVMNQGSDGNTLLDICDQSIIAGESIGFTYSAPVPIYADSIGKLACQANRLELYFPKKIKCSSIALDGSDFSITGASAPIISSAYGFCIGGLTEYIMVNFTERITKGGNFTLNLKSGLDGNIFQDICGLQVPAQSLNFEAGDTVSAVFTYTLDLACRENTIHLVHDGAHDVNSWTWFNNTIDIGTTRTLNPIVSAHSNNTIRLDVTNGFCSAVTAQVINMDNEVKADFNMPDILCPEDAFLVENKSTGRVDTWRWNFDALASNNSRTPAPYLFPSGTKDSYYSIKLVATNNTLTCSDSIQKMLRVLSTCFIAVPSAFTPNGDGLNDYLSPNNAIKAENLDFRVYNRWGQEVFQSKDWTRKWNGKTNGVPQAPGVFVWFLSYTNRDTGKKVFQKGTTTLIL